MKAAAPAVRLAWCLLLLTAAGCAPRAAPRGPANFPKEDDYERPSVSGLNEKQAAVLSDAWAAIGVGDTAAAIQSLGAALRKDPNALSLRTALGYAYLRVGRTADAKAEFDAVLARDSAQRAALVGAATSARKLGKVEEALALYRSARNGVGVDSPMLDRRIAELSAARADSLVADARRLRGSNDLEAALAAYARALEAAPGLVGLRLEWADVLIELGRRDDAVRLLQQSDPTDRGSRLYLAQLFAEEGNVAEAATLLEALHQALPADAEVAERLAELRRSRTEAAVPDEVRDIAAAQWATRADLAALLVATVPEMAESASQPPPVATDIEGLWGREYILKALSLGLMETYPNHTFQPDATIRRGDLGHALGRALARLGVAAPATPPAMKDVTPNNRLYPEIAAAVSAGLLPLNAEGAFEAWRPVTGAEAVRAVAALTARLHRP